MAPDAVVGGGAVEFAGADVLGEAHAGKLDHRDGNRQQNEGEGDASVGDADGGGLLGAVGLEGGGGEGVKFLWRERGGAEDDGGAEEGGDGGAEGVEGLREIEAGGGGALRAEVGDVGVGGDLERGDAGGEDDEGAEEERKGGDGGGRDEEQGAHGHDKESRDHGALVADPFDDLAGGLGEDEVGGEEGELDHHGLGEAELEDGFEMGDEDVVEAGEETPHEEEHGGDRHGSDVGGFEVIVDGGAGGLH